jgi:carbonic anhydrase/acetyltransferase-like protein (isoleucine patch superfamily)
VPLFEFEGRRPSVHPTAFVAPTAALIGDVRIEAGASVWYNAVLRGDTGPIVVREGANVQDGSVLHGGEDPVTEIGAGATIGHLCMVHGAVIGPECVVGNGATIQDGARLGARSMVGAGATVPPNKVVDEGALVQGPPGTPRGPLTPEAERWVRTNPEIYRELAQRHRRTVTEV